LSKPLVKMVFRSLFFVLFLPSLAQAQLSKKDSVWLQMSSFIGTWKGEGGGEPGQGQYERTYEWGLDKNFIVAKNKSVFLPNKVNQKGAVHEDIGYISFDKKLKCFKIRQFHVEGFVNEYQLEDLSLHNGHLVFKSVALENIPTGWQAKETYRWINHDEFEEIFEIAMPNADFSVYSKVRLIRQPK
jgi:hypothetical protein